MKKLLTFLMLSIFAIGVGWAAEVTDVLTQATTGVTGTNYTSWSGKTLNSAAVYAGQSAGGNNSIQLRSNNSNSGIITTGSGGKVKSVTIAFNSNTASGRTVDIYGKNTAYSDPTDLYNSSTRGTKIGSIVYGTSTSITVSGDYAFIGLRSNSGALYIESLTIVWEDGTSSSGVSTPVISGTTPFVGSTQVSISCETSGASIYYTTDGNDPTTSSTLYSAPFTINATTTVKAIAVKNSQTSNVASMLFTALQAISSIAEFNGLAVNDNFKYTGNNLVYIKSNSGGNNHYVQDGSKGMLIYGSLDQTYQPGDVIPGGFTGTRAEFNGAPEMTNPDGFTTSSQNVGLTPMEITPSQVNLDNFGRYAIIKNAAFNTSAKTITAGGETIGYHTTFNNSIPTDGAAYDVIGICGYYQNNPQFLPISFDPSEVTGADYYLVGSFNMDGDNWIQQDENYKFTALADGGYILNNKTLPDGVRFKILKVDGNDVSWLGGSAGDYFGITKDVCTNIQLVDGADFYMAAGGNCTFTVSADQKLTVSKEAQLFLAGTFNNWGKTDALEATSDGWTIEKELSVDDEFKFVDEWGSWYGGGNTIAEVNLGATIALNTGGNFKMGVDGNFVINVAANKSSFVINRKAETSTAMFNFNDDYAALFPNLDLTTLPYDIVDPITATVDGISVTISPKESSSNTTNKIWNNNNKLRVYSGTITVTAPVGYNLTGIEFTNHSSNFNLTPSEGEMGGSGGARTWTGETATLVLTATGNTQIGTMNVTISKANSNAPAAPVIEGETPFMETTTVTITAEDGAAIYYTTNGDTPSSESTLYQAPFQLTETATVKAIAVKNEASSAIATKTFVKTPQLASATEFYSYEGTDEFVFTGNLVAIAQTGKYLYAQDNAKGVLIFGTIDKTYNKGDKIPAGFHAKKGAYHGAPQMADPTSMQGATEQATIEPVELTVDQITLDNYARYAIIKNVKYENGNYTVGDATLTIYDRFGIEFTPEEGKTYDIVGVSGWYDGAQFMPLEFKEVRESYEVRWGQGDPWEQENVIAMYLDVITGKWSVADQEMPAGSEFKIVKKRDNGDGNPTLTWLGAIADGMYWITADNLGTEITLGSTDAHKNLFFEDAGNYTFTFDPSNSTLVVTATEYYYRVENEGNCTVTDLGNGSATIGQTVTVRVLPDSGYKFKEASITRDASNNPDIEETPIGYTITPVEGSSNQVDLSFVMPGSDVQINVFCDVVYPISINVGPGGMATTDKAEASEGETVTVTVTPSNDYRLDEITYSYTIDGNATTTQPQFIANGQYSFTMPAAAVAINVTFKKFNNQVKFDANPVGGTVVVKANDNAISSMDYVVEGTAMVVEATPAEGYELKSLMVYEGILNEGADLDQAEEISCTLQDGKYLFTMPTSNVTIIAEFTQILYDLEGVAFDIDRDWATYFNSARNLALPEDIKAYVVTGVTNDAVEITEINYIPAGVGVLLHSTEIINEITTTLYTGETGTHTSMLVGSDEAQNITEGYVLYNNAFYRSESGTVAAHRCYLPATQVAGAPRMLKIGVSDVPTAIESIIAQGNVAGIKYVNLSGMTSDEPWRGVNIAVITLTDGTTRTIKVIK